MTIEIDEKELFVAERRRKRIKLRELAEELDCSIALISQYELEKSTMCQFKIDGYKKFIKNYEIER